MVIDQGQLLAVQIYFMNRRDIILALVRNLFGVQNRIFGENGRTIIPNPDLLLDRDLMIRITFQCLLDLLTRQMGRASLFGILLQTDNVGI